MKSKELRQMKEDQLKAKKTELMNSMFKARIQLHTGENTNTAAMNGIRKDIARINTLLNEKKKMGNA